MELSEFALSNAMNPNRILGSTVLIIGLVFATANTALAGGANGTMTAATPSTPTTVNPGNTQVTSGANCVQQYNDHGTALEQTSQNIAIAQTALDAAGMAAEAAGEADPLTGAAAAAGIAIQITSLGLGIADLPNQQAQINLGTEMNGLPYCDQAFTGTISVSAGGSNISGNSIYNNNLGVVQNVNVGGDVTASQVRTTQGISTNGGGIVIGDRNLTTFSSGITIGGGALSGAGFGGEQAYTGDVTAIAIGNSSRAEAVNSTAMGTGARASGAGSTAVGQGAQATAANSAAFGAGAVAALPNQQVFGTTAETYTMPGITSGASKARQVGRLQLPTTDAFGNLASDGGDTFRAIAANRAGIAISLALEAPELATGENFGIRVGWGNFDAKAQAVGISVIGVVARGLIVNDDRVVINGGFGWGQSEFMDYDQTAIMAGRAGLQWSW